jgi:hypothetical protein
VQRVGGGRLGGRRSVDRLGVAKRHGAKRAPWRGRRADRAATPVVGRMDDRLSAVVGGRRLVRARAQV